VERVNRKKIADSNKKGLERAALYEAEQRKGSRLQTMIQPGAQQSRSEKIYSFSDLPLYFTLPLFWF
jgi:hypothetical protein